MDGEDAKNGGVVAPGSRFCAHSRYQGGCLTTVANSLINNVPNFMSYGQVYLDPALDASNVTGDDMFVFGLHPHGVTSSYRILLDGVTREKFPKVLPEVVMRRCCGGWGCFFIFVRFCAARQLNTAFLVGYSTCCKFSKWCGSE